ncbi:mitochondrial ATPase expression-domain-containing protein, partial [Talaromyces proteolyticus]
RERLSRILQGGQPDQILAAMSDLDNEPIIATMPDSVFVSALLLITPEHFLEPYKRILGRIHDHVLFSKGYQSFKEVLRQYFASLFAILYMRSRGDRHVGLVEYTHLLRCAASAADLSIALTIWKSLENKNLSPSLECYNSIMTTGLWDQVHTGKERYRLRVTPFYSNRRSTTDGRARGYRGFGTGSQSVRMQTLAILYQMRKANIDIDEATHINALIAHAKDGFVPGVRQVLEETWGIFPFHLDAGYENHPPVKPIPRSSPLYPTINLIWAVAHAFGINHDLPTALRTVEFISRTYDIKITDEVWLELFERAYVLAAKQFNKPDEALLGQISQDLVYGMGRNLQEVPSHSKMHLYRNLSRISYNNHNLEEFTSVLEDAHKHLVQTKKRRKHALQVLENCMEVSLTVDPHRASALREYEILRLEVLQQRTLIERIVRLGYSGHFLKEIPPAMWARKVLPEFLAQWRDFIPECFFAILHGGLGSIEFHGRTIYQHRNIRPHNYEPVRWSKCGEFIADDEEFEPIDDYLWSSIR